MHGTGRQAPEWIQTLYLASVWKIPPWEIEDKYLNDANAAQWIIRAVDVSTMQNTAKERDKVRIVVF